MVESKNSIKNDNEEKDEKIIFEEKYRPKTFDKNKFLGNEELRKTFQRYVEEGSFPHLLLIGQAGVGKTTTAEILARSIVVSGADILILNASDDNSIKVVRTTIKNFARSRARDEKSLKVIILDEMDNMTKPSQQALRRIMEMYNENVRFVGTCNFPNRIIEPIKSRCTEFHFKKIPSNDIVNRLKEICIEEGIDISKDDMENMVDSFNGDMRKCVGTLYTVKKGGSLKAIVENNSPIKFINILKDKDLVKMMDYVEDYVYDDIAFTNLLLNTSRFIINDKDFNENDKKLFIYYLSESAHRLALGTRPELVAYWLLIKLNDDLEKK